MNRGILRGLWNKPECVPNRITIIRGDPTFSGKNPRFLGRRFAVFDVFCVVLIYPLTHEWVDQYYIIIFGLDDRQIKAVPKKAILSPSLGLFSC
jgi:hypothetical protein